MAAERKMLAHQRSKVGRALLYERPRSMLSSQLTIAAVAWALLAILAVFRFGPPVFDLLVRPEEAFPGDTLRQQELLGLALGFLLVPLGFALVTGAAAALAQRGVFWRSPSKTAAGAALALLIEAPIAAFTVFLIRALAEANFTLLGQLPQFTAGPLKGQGSVLDFVKNPDTYSITELGSRYGVAGYQPTFQDNILALESVAVFCLVGAIALLSIFRLILAVLTVLSLLAPRPDEQDLHGLRISAYHHPVDRIPLKRVLSEAGILTDDGKRELGLLKDEYDFPKTRLAFDEGVIVGMAFFSKKTGYLKRLLTNPNSQLPADLALATDYQQWGYDKSTGVATIELESRNQRVVDTLVEAGWFDNQRRGIFTKRLKEKGRKVDSKGSKKATPVESSPEAELQPAELEEQTGPTEEVQLPATSASQESATPEVSQEISEPILPPMPRADRPRRRSLAVESTAFDLDYDEPPTPSPAPEISPQESDKPARRLPTKNPFEK